MAATADPTQPSPKFIWPVIVGLILTALSTALVAVTPDMFAFLGDFSGVGFAFVTALGMGLTAWLKSDPLRQNYGQQFAAYEADAARKADSANLTADISQGRPQDDGTEGQPYIPPANHAG